jgi:hypothetical protein
MRKKSQSNAGRPRRNPDDVVKAHVLFYMVRGIDDDLIDWFSGLDVKQRWAATKQLIRLALSDSDELRISLIPGEDDDLISQIGNADNKEQMAKRMMRTGIVDDQGNDDGDDCVDDLLDL